MNHELFHRKNLKQARVLLAWFGGHIMLTWHYTGVAGILLIAITHDWAQRVISFEPLTAGQELYDVGSLTKLSNTLDNGRCKW